MYTKDMKKKRVLKHTITYILLLGFILGILTGCGGGETGSDVPYFHSSLRADQDTQGAVPTEMPEQAQQTEERELYLIVEIDQIEESLRLYRYVNGMEYRYYYGTGTRFYDKYGTRTTVMNFTVGAAITIGDVDSEGILREAQVSDRVWTYDGISRFAIEEERQIFEIADNRYHYDDAVTYVFSNDERVAMSDVARGDTLTVVGMDKEILSVRVTTGQGTLVLKNTELFEGSFLQLGTRVFAEITPDMQLTVEEGTYMLTVANDGWGGSCEVTVTRGESVTVDLDKLKGEGPRTGKIQFVIDVTDAVLVLDGKTLDYAEPVELTYGKHSLAVYANGYDAWERNLYVNSEESTILIELKEEQKKKDEAEETQKSSEKNSSESNSSKKTEAETRKEELDLIRDLLTNSVL